MSTTNLRARIYSSTSVPGASCPEPPTGRVIPGHTTPCFSFLEWSQFRWPRSFIARRMKSTTRVGARLLLSPRWVNGVHTRPGPGVLSVMLSHRRRTLLRSINVLFPLFPTLEMWRKVAPDSGCQFCGGENVCSGAVEVVIYPLRRHRSRGVHAHAPVNPPAQRYPLA